MSTEILDQPRQESPLIDISRRYPDLSINLEEFAVTAWLAVVLKMRETTGEPLPLLPPTKQETVRDGRFKHLYKLKLLSERPGEPRVSERSSGEFMGYLAMASVRLEQELGESDYPTVHAYFQVVDQATVQRGGYYKQEIGQAALLDIADVLAESADGLSRMVTTSQREMRRQERLARMTAWQEPADY